MSKTQIDIDDDLLAQAGEILGTTTKRATVEAALRATTAKHARRRLGDLIAESDMTPAELDRQADEAWR
ncbi:type II toxin-antitoxin system VapB family antitoxin [Phytoactinopolyspora mesophila]|uniref:Type II toxin-antitoxin system VapB family antitoxin n=1 Tax=Phytoactinopolyspora mesophila TaxID=2650750 RepID=A0A7K3M6G6_9ACTN|nr:type II toxin-antitoxin system VapB family antitoxin [Phytoactinopolyspora mesophila]NDL58866.1 type II toxin-antitoxin system VapB family antitoxin [Phytoactinopolyspora mesophila]